MTKVQSWELNYKNYKNTDVLVKSKQTHMYNVTAVHTSNTMTGLFVVLCILCVIEVQGLAKQSTAFQ